MKTASPDHVRPAGPARDRLLAAADALFYQEGVNAVGIDRVIEQAGVAKASLYNAFGSKEELVRAYLQQRQTVRVARVARHLALHTAPRARLLAVFDALAEAVGDPKFRGCAFIKASAELCRDGAVDDLCNASRAWTRDLFRDLARAAGVGDPDGLARRLHLVYDGALVAAQMDKDPAHVAMTTARAVAATLVDAELPA